MISPIVFGVIIPTYNRPYYLMEAVQSVLDQTYPDWKIFVCNDCSVADYSAVTPLLSDPRIFLTKTEVNGGCNAARNVAIDLAVKEGCDYLVFMDDEDKLDQLALEIGSKTISAHPEVSWFVSNTTGDRKESQRDIVVERHYDWLDDYVYGKSLRGDKTHMIAAKTLGEIRFDGRYRASNMWPFYLPLSARTKIWGYVYPSRIIRYLDDGITKTNTRYPKNWLELYSRFAQHALAIRIRPFKLLAYKYLILELLKSIKRVIYLVSGKAHEQKASIGSRRN